MHDILDIKKRQYIDILANRGIGIKNNPSLGALQTKVSYLKKTRPNSLSQIKRSGRG